MSYDELPQKLKDIISNVTNKRAKFVIDSIIQNGSVSTEEINKQGYEHAPRAVRDVRELGIPLETFYVKNSQGKRIGAYRFGDITAIRNNVLQGRKVFPKNFKAVLAKQNGEVCEIDNTHYTLAYLQIDHRVPYQVAGDSSDITFDDFMLLCSSCNRSKSWSCESCSNWLETQDIEVCRTCYWANPNNYSHMALKDIRRVDVIFENEDIKLYEEMKHNALQNETSIANEIIKSLKEK